MRRVALVTGSRRGIGYGIAVGLAGEGCDLVINGTGDEESIRDPLEQLRSLGAEVLYCQADVSVPQDRRRLLERTVERFGTLHVLVNNAGVAPKARADILEAGEESFERLMRINLQGPYFLTQAAARLMIEGQKKQPQSFRCIVNVSSISALVASVSRGEYCISKAGVSMATKLWAVRLAEFGIPVYEVQPGVIETDMTAPVKARYDALIAGELLLQKRWGLPGDVGRAVAMLARGELPYSTGQVIAVDGGLMVPRL